MSASPSCGSYYRDNGGYGGYDRDDGGYDRVRVAVLRRRLLLSCSYGSYGSDDYDRGHGSGERVRE